MNSMRMNNVFVLSACLALTISCPLGAALEFGRYQGRQAPTRTQRLGKRSMIQSLEFDPLRLLQEFDEVLDETVQLMSFSLSMSMADPSERVKSPPSLTNGPTPAPEAPPSPVSTTNPSPSQPSSPSAQLPSAVPSAIKNDPSTTPGPSTPLNESTLSPATTGSPSPTTFAPTPSSSSSSLAFECSDGIRLGPASANATMVQIVVGYNVESTSNTTDDYLSDLESELFTTVILAILGDCENDNRKLQSGATTDISIETLEIDECPSTLNETESCAVLETEMIFFLNGDQDLDIAQYLAYAKIEEEMTEDGYVGIVPTVLLVEYVSPLPLVPPPPLVVGSEAFTQSPVEVVSTSADRLSVSPWTIGACAATVMGGIVSLMVWSRNRRSRQRRHMHALQDHSALHSSSRNPVAI